MVPWLHAFWRIGLLTLFVVGSAWAADSSWEDDRSPLGKAKAWARDVEAMARVHSDPVLRSIVCRVPYEDFTVEAIMRATKIPGPRLKRAVQLLERMGLVEVVQNGNVMRLVPASEKAREKMRRWSEQWCVGDDACSVAR